jgi:hypothetical protein
VNAGDSSMAEPYRTVWAVAAAAAFAAAQIMVLLFPGPEAAARTG